MMEGEVERHIVLADVGGWRFEHAGLLPMRCCFSLVDLVQNHYPERLRECSSLLCCVLLCLLFNSHSLSSHSVSVNCTRYSSHEQSQTASL